MFMSLHKESHDDCRIEKLVATNILRGEITQDSSLFIDIQEAKHDVSIDPHEQSANG